jgi:hypothetical protein
MVKLLGTQGIAALGALALVIGCNRTPEPTPGAKPTSGPVVAQSAGAAPPAMAPPAKPGGLVWDVPSAWSTAPTKSSMRLATYHVPAAPGDADEAEMAVSRAGGSVDANIERWKEQMGSPPAGFPKREDVKVGNLKVTLFEHRGTFAAGNMMPGGPGEAAPKPGWAMLAAIVELGGQAAPYFFKITGPEKSVAAARADFDKLVGSLRTK